MRNLCRAICIALLAASVSAVAPGHVQADINGFGDFSGFTVNQSDAKNNPTVSIASDPLASSIALIGGAGETRSIFYNAPQNISSSFTASFTYQNTGNDADTNGLCFVLQNSSSGASSIGGGFGYNQMSGDSMAVLLEQNNQTGYYTNGSVNGGTIPVSPINFTSGDPINVSLIYNGSTLHESLLDMSTSASFDTSYLIHTPIPTVLGGNSAYVGLTDGSYYLDSTSDKISNFKFESNPVPEPSTLALLSVAACLGVALIRRRGRARS